MCNDRLILKTKYLCGLIFATKVRIDLTRNKLMKHLIQHSKLRLNHMLFLRIKDQSISTLRTQFVFYILIFISVTQGGGIEWYVNMRQYQIVHLEHLAVFYHTRQVYRVDFVHWKGTVYSY